MEILDGFSQLGGNVGKHRLEFCKGFAHNLCIFKTYTALGGGIGDEHHDAPIFFSIVIIVGSVLRGDEAQHFAFEVGCASSFEFLAYVGGNFDDVAHEQVDVGEDSDIDVLEHIVGGVARGDNGIGGVDESVAEGMNIGNFALNGELLSDVFKLLFHCYGSISRICERRYGKFSISPYLHPEKCNCIWQKDIKWSSDACYFSSFLVVSPQREESNAPLGYCWCERERNFRRRKVRK